MRWWVLGLAVACSGESSTNTQQGAERCAPSADPVTCSVDELFSRSDCTVLDGGFFVGAEGMFIDGDFVEATTGLLAGVEEIRGGLSVDGLKALDGLERLRVVEGLTLEGAFTDLSPLSCLEQAGPLQLARLRTPDLGGMRGVSVSSIVVTDTRLQSLDGLAPSSVLSGPFTLTGNTVLEDVGALAAVTEVEGSVVLGGAVGAGLPGLTTADTLTIQDVTSPHLDLRSLVEVQSLLIEVNPGLESVRLDALRTAESVTIVANGALEALSLPSFETAQTVDIGGHQALTTLGPMNALKHLQALTIHDNPSLASFDEVDAEHIDYLTIAGNDSLVTLDAFNNSPSMLVISVDTNPSLVDIVGFRGLTTPESVGVEIQGNAVLSSVSGFGSLQTGGVLISGNPLLTSVLGFSSLAGGGVDLSYNAALETVSFPSLVHPLALAFEGGGSYRFTGFESVRTVGSLEVSFTESSDLAALDGIETLDYAYFESNTQMCTSYLEAWAFARGVQTYEWNANAGC